MDLVTVMKNIGIECKITRPNSIALTDIPSVPTADDCILVPDILRINKALQDAGLLGKWRARKGGTTKDSWILIFGKK